ncbi:hypothetical protein HCQ94_02730 [Actinomyces sp. zg-332]|uniref:phosphoribosyltransferase n=1 Tax=Actinomyces sp. zg-332 TaxID=2708340 RepID=UPI00141E3786|nr:phosphoribosyltransferase [Actinomyces sp. zg-332]QPK94632.1 hypothetical protein HCQ94_02730 [Actinomyces sp. zg-332]
MLDLYESNIRVRFFITYLPEQEYGFKAYNLALSSYTDFWRQIILILKHSKIYSYDNLIQVLAEVIFTNLLKIENKNILSFRKGKVILSYIPSSWGRRIKGRNNNYFLAKQLLLMLRKESVDVALSKLIEFKFFTLSQSGKSDAQRKENRENSMIVLEENFPFHNLNISTDKDTKAHFLEKMVFAEEKREPSFSVLEGKTFIFIEDVITTGATTNALLKEIGKHITCKDTVLIVSIANVNIQSQM